MMPMLAKEHSKATVFGPVSSHRRMHVCVSEQGRRGCHWTHRLGVKGAEVCDAGGGGVGGPQAQAVALQGGFHRLEPPILTYSVTPRPLSAQPSRRSIW